MPTQRPYFLSSFLSAFRQQGPSLPPSQQANKHTTQATPTSSSVAAAAANSSSSPAYHGHSSASSASSASRTATTVAAAAAAAATPSPHAYGRSPPTGVSIHSRGPITSANGIPIPNPSSSRRRGSDSSSEGFRDRLGADKWYIGGRTATGEERFFKLGVIKRVRSNDGLSLDRLSL
ncbi:hypothetical protein L249_4434 [Ophiocordyceps polyrhachis-furcata BCC 54312]|uniref:Uncharacterized protein n=1 Tax=Ophiocordyceps polyrhachis-furcata BCC 54312 TaxID=1330021 RepID=A0A367L831_9HYPO|nr:hypothetical protein L249_4434 [Ophiocordyceps polyrhachis-furcata BCC 54312]